MQATTLSFENLHDHGALFANLLRARKQSFIVQNNWDLPEAMGMEFDQYDTPASRWLAVHDYGRVLAGVRLTPTTARCGIYSYMIRDAQAGLLDSLPRDLIDAVAPVDPNIWEASRVFVAHDIPAGQRRAVHASLVEEMNAAARSLGIVQAVALVPANWGRWAGRCGLTVHPAGRVMRMGGIDYQAVTIRFLRSLH